MYRFLVAISLSIGSISSAMSSSNPSLERLALSQKGSIVLNKTSIADLKIGMTETEVIKKLGIPQSRKIAPNECTGTKGISLKYSNLDIYLLGGTVKKSENYLASVNTTNPRYVTDREIRVGDLMNKAERAYSKAAIAGYRGLQLSLADSKSNECALIFLSRNGKTIGEISLTCAIC